MESRRDIRVLVFIVAYNAERTIQPVLARIPAALARYDTHVLIIDDSSTDGTFQRARDFDTVPFPITVLYNPVNLGYGGNQKVGFHYAIRERFDFVALIHGDGQYAPEKLPDLLQPLIAGEAEAVFGSRMSEGRSALRSGMPFYKFVGNKILTTVQNRLLGTTFSEFHSGYRIYSTRALAAIPFDRNTNDFHFDTEIFIQLLRAGLRIKELPIPTYYGDEVCHVNGLKYAFNVVTTTLLSRAQDLAILYERKYDLTLPERRYQAKTGFESSHTFAADRVAPGAKVLDIGCSSGHVARMLQRKGCEVTGVDQFPVAADAGLKRFIRMDLNNDRFPVDAGSYDFVLMLDVIEHLRSPEAFVDSLRQSRRERKSPTVIVTTPNVAFWLTRLMLLLGYFNYGSRGILDLTHTRLFTFASLRNLFEQSGYRVEGLLGIPAPFPLALGEGAWARVLVKINRALIRLSRSLFSYQIFMVARPLPTLDWLLETAIETSRSKVAAS
jgi:glycosyltransferase involved in cell wall biosynthesis